MTRSAPPIRPATSVVPAILTMALGLAGGRCGKDAGPSRPRPKKTVRKTAAVGPLAFHAERIRLDVEPGRLSVDGSYVFWNRGARRWRGRISYPIAVLEKQKPPREVVMDGHRSLAVRCRKSFVCAAVFSLEVPARQKRTVRLRYAQRLTAERAVYMVTSTAKWREPLERAEFEIRLPASWTDVRVSHQPHKSSIQGAHRVLKLVKRDFMPRRDLEVTWSRPAAER